MNDLILLRLSNLFKKEFFLAASFILILNTFSQRALSQSPSEKIIVKPILSFQLWSSYTIGQEIFDAESYQYLPVDDRVNFQLRRSRVGLKGRYNKRLSFNFTGAVDLVGRDVLSATEAGSNNGSAPSFRLWNAFVQWKANSKNEKINLVFGYLIPQIGRESITSAFRSTSMEKAWSQNYLRKHVTGIGPGRAMGMNVGGIFQNEDSKTGFRYDLGLFNPVFQAFGGNSVGRNYSLVLTGKLIFEIGDPAGAQYSISHKVNYFGKRNGVSVGLFGTTQGKTDLFTKNQTIGVDLLLNWGNLNIDGDWTKLMRSGHTSEQRLGPVFTSIYSTGYIRTSYNVNLKERIIEPVFMLMGFEGLRQLKDQEKSKALGIPSGMDAMVDIGINYYFNQNLKLSLHYTIRSGDRGEIEPGIGINNYFSQPGLGAIRRGNWVGVGLVSIL